ncbi:MULTISPECIES: DUF4148 domain-containing protein [Caballeronia]|uniref:DUF4148 domain-containing protein n=1 Tax=Caballeronia TaxID=1827195 RepID=UPI001EDD5D81|nr:MULTISPECIES: DUF4148 domain-containing protein [Caballeronia]MDR5743591.1 DUF4148 domain-containing protein [Caballeronia sp. LZ029]
MRRLTVICLSLVIVCAGGAFTLPLGLAQAKTREQARTELEQAWRDGWLPYRRSEYPPSPATLDRNKKRYLTQHPEGVGSGANAKKRTD